MDGILTGIARAEVGPSGGSYGVHRRPDGRRPAERQLQGQEFISDPYRLFVTTSKEINAFALPGGTIVFHRGLLERARTAEEIQGVLAHEMAHVQNWV